jgi:hypothetical protein
LNALIGAKRQQRHRHLILLQEALAALPLFDGGLRLGKES